MRPPVNLGDGPDQTGSCCITVDNQCCPSLQAQDIPIRANVGQVSSPAKLSQTLRALAGTSLREIFTLHCLKWRWLFYQGAIKHLPLSPRCRKPSLLSTSRLPGQKPERLKYCRRCFESLRAPAQQRQDITCGTLCLIDCVDVKMCDTSRQADMTSLFCVTSNNQNYHISFNEERKSSFPSHILKTKQALEPCSKFFVLLRLCFRYL